MKTKIFLAFLIVIFTAFLSNIIFEQFITRDFENYVNRVIQDQVYWISTSAESSYDNGKWDAQLLTETVHWAMMMGLDVRVVDNLGREIVSSHTIMGSLPHVMEHRMEGLFNVHATQGSYEKKPLYHKENAVGMLYWRPFQKKEIAEKEAVFKWRIKYFLFISFIIAGIGSFVLAIFLSRYLSKPVTNLMLATEKISKGDFSARTAHSSRDEVGKLSQVFNSMAESLQREEKLRRQLLSNIAHELRTPLTIMKTHVEAMRDGIITDTEKGIDNIYGELTRLSKLVGGIEDVTTAEASFFTKAEETEINLGEFISGIAADLLPLFHEKKLSLKVSDHEEIIVNTDVEKLERIMRNILSNALKFTEKGGVSIHYGTDTNIFFIEINDTGRGIPDNKMQLIFDRFYKGEKTDTQGLGLGLAIVKELINIMHGEIQVRSAVNEGTNFRIILPLSKK
jgi:two-component system sensor histidine kinase BaeS